MLTPPPDAKCAGSLYRPLTTRRDRVSNASLRVICGMEARVGIGHRSLSTTTPYTHSGFHFKRKSAYFRVCQQMTNYAGAGGSAGFAGAFAGGPNQEKAAFFVKLLFVMPMRDRLRKGTYQGVTPHEVSG